MKDESKKASEISEMLSQHNETTFIPFSYQD
jgi:hypothetical protein